MRYTFILPSSFDPLEFLTTPRLRMRADDARWLMSTIVRKTAHRDTDIRGCVRLHSDVLYRVLGNHAGKVVRALEAGGAIETTPYRAGVQTKGYRLARRYLGDHSVRVPCVDPLLLDRLAREQERMQKHAEKARARWLPIHHALDREQRHLTIDADADDILDGLPDHTRLCQDVLVERLRHREFSFSLSTTGRVFNAVTGLKCELRTALRIGGEPVGGVDIACAQPALLALEMARGTPSNGPKGAETYKHYAGSSPASAPRVPAPAPVPCPDSFASLVLSGTLYEFLAERTGLTRGVVKRRFLVDVLAKKGRYPSAVERALREAFPEVYRFVRMVNRNDPAELIRRLQGLESWLVIEQVAPLLVGRVPCITLHDAIFSRRSALDTVEEAFEEVFAEIGFHLRLKREAAEGGAVAAADKLTEAGR